MTEMWTQWALDRWYKAPVTIHWANLCVACPQTLLHLACTCLHSEMHPCSSFVSEGNGNRALNNVKKPRLKLIVTSMPLNGWEAFRKSFFSLFLAHYCGLGFICKVELLTRSGTNDCLLVCPSQRPRTVLAHTVFFFIFMWLWFTNILFFAYSKCSLQSRSEPITPPEAGSGKAPELTDGWLGNLSSATGQRNMPVHSAGEQRPLGGWDTGILCYSFCMTKGDYQDASFWASPGHCSY